MGASLEKQQERQHKNYKQKKRQNHPIFGELVTVQCISTSKLYTLKSMNMQNLICNQQIKQLQSLSENGHQNHYVSIKKLQMQTSILSCGSQKNGYILFDCTEVDLQRIQESQHFAKLKQHQIINLIWCVLEGLITLQNKKISAFPICKKSVLLHNYSDEYRGEDLSQAIFKVIPINLIKQQAIKITTSPFLFPPQIENSVASQAKSALLLQFTPKNHIYCLGMMILDIIYHQQKKFQQISFGDHTNKSKSYNKQTQIQTLQGCGLSFQLVQIIKSMIQQDQTKRVGLTSLYDTCKIILQKNNAKVTLKSQNFYKILQKQSLLTSKLSCRSKKSTVFGSVGPLYKSKQKYGTEQKQNQIFSVRQSHFRSQKIISLESTKQLADVTNIQSSRNMRDCSISKCSLFKQNDHYHSGVQSRKLPQRLYFQNGAFYEGQLNKKGQFNGFGTLYYSQSEICYTGYWKKNNFHGFGYLFNNYYAGKKQTDLIDSITINYKDFSQGSQTNKQRIWKHYEGQFKDDKKDGFGILFFVDGSKFEGQFNDSKCNGTGTFIKADGSSINGLWRNNRLIKEYN